MTASKSNAVKVVIFVVEVSTLAVSLSMSTRTGSHLCFEWYDAAGGGKKVRYMVVKQRKSHGTSNLDAFELIEKLLVEVHQCSRIIRKSEVDLFQG
jgi:hypothetical protein